MLKDIKQFLSLDFKLLDSVLNRCILIICIGVYSAFFIGLYTPFNINTWGQDSYLKYVILGITVISFSQFILRPLLGLKTFKIRSLIFWCLFEMLIMATILHLTFAPETSSGTINDNIIDYLDTIRIVLLVATVPYVLVVLYFGFKEKLSTIQDSSKDNLGSFHDPGNNLLTVMGDNNKVVIAVKYNRILCIKSAGNYLEFYYLKGGELSKQLIRGRLKEMEERIVNTNIVKVHRSYLINVRHISSLKKTKKSYEIIIQHIPEILIPVSVGYKATFEESLKQRVSH